MLRHILKLTFPEIIELLRLDVYFALFLFGLAIPSVTASQFIQDKFCINQLKLDPSQCLHLETLGPEYEEIKNKVYAFSTIFKNYQHLITTPPGIILSVFMGYWIDSYPKHLKYLLALPCFGGFLSAIFAIYHVIYFELDVYSLLWLSVVHGLTGGFFIVMTGSYTYITRRTKAKYRAARFAILELFIFTSIPLATAIGGRLLTTKPWFGGQYRNYFAVFFISLVCKLSAMIWVLIFLNDADKTIDDLDELDRAKNDIKLDLTKPLPIKPGDEKMVEIELDPQKTDSVTPVNENKEVMKNMKPTGFIEIFLDIFNPSTVSNMIKVCCQKRPNNGRKILWNLMFAMNVMLIGHMGESTIGFPFAQKVYHWDAAYYSFITSVMMIIPTLSHSFLPIILIHKFHLPDTVLAIIGAVSLIFALIVRGGILESCAFYISTIIGLCAGLLPIAIRSIISRIIDQKEVGQVFALLACIESSGPMVASVVYSTLFSVTIQDFPGLVHHFAALTMFYPFAVVLWLDLTRHKWDKTAITELENKKKQKIIEKKESDSVNNNPNGNECFTISSKVD
uniref:Major facilitator superfamily (MFS) profile domain-containing protein n=2 Tax=Tetranychus urticae TaxID=32264 RepID=T1KLD2_TETUR